MVHQYHFSKALTASACRAFLGPGKTHLGMPMSGWSPFANATSKSRRTVMNSSMAALASSTCDVISVSPTV